VLRQRTTRSFVQGKIFHFGVWELSSPSTPLRNYAHGHARQRRDLAAAKLGLLVLCEFWTRVVQCDCSHRSLQTGVESSSVWFVCCEPSLRTVRDGADLRTGRQPSSDFRSCRQVHTWRRLPVLSAGPAVTFPVADRARCLTGTNLYCLVTAAHACKQLA